MGETTETETVVRRGLVAITAAAASFAVLCSPAAAACGSPVMSGARATVTCAAGSGAVSVPDHVGGVTLEALGASGGTSALQPFSGSGGSAQGTITEAGPFSLSVVVGSAGAAGSAGGAGGAPAGGNGALGPNGGGGGGGGYTQVIDTTTSTTLATVGGGGGSGGSNTLGAGGSGGGGDTSFYPGGQPGGLCITPPVSSCGGNAFVDGGGATTTAPGAGDSHPEAPGTHVDGSPGLLNTGGNAGVGTGGGGGGAGCFGGGGGGTDHNGAADGGGGAGGGSTCIDGSLSSVTDPAVGSGDGQVIVTYTIPAANPPGTQSSGGGFVVLGAGSPAPPVTATSSGTIGVKLGCGGAAGTTCTGQVSVSAHEKVRGSKVIAVSAGALKAKRKQVVIGLAKYTIKAGQVKVVKVTLNRRGRALLTQFHRLTVKVVVSVATANGLRTAVTKTVTIKAAKKKHKK